MQQPKETTNFASVNKLKRFRFSCWRCGLHW
nr:MAG TPA: hypothetical protein [Caudoviricetes sp.]